MLNDVFEIVLLQSTVLRIPCCFVPFPFLFACNERILIRALVKQHVLVLYEACHRNNAAIEGGPRLGEVNYIAC